MAIMYSGQAQKEIQHLLEIKGGYLIDQDDNRASYLDDTFGDEYRLNYRGLKYVAIGYTQVKNRDRYGIEIDYFKYGNFSQIYIGTGPVPPNRRQNQIQFSFFYGKSIINAEKINLFVAPIASFAIRTNTLYGTLSLDTPIRDRIIGIGGKLQANYNITNRLGFSIGSKLMVVDYFSRNISYGQIEPNQFDFIRDDVVLQMGFVFNF